MNIYIVYHNNQKQASKSFLFPYCEHHKLHVFLNPLRILHVINTPIAKNNIKEKSGGERGRTYKWEIPLFLSKMHQTVLVNSPLTHAQQHRKINKSVDSTSYEYGEQIICVYSAMAIPTEQFPSTMLTRLEFPSTMFMGMFQLFFI